MRSSRVTVSALVLLALTGCGTFLNLKDSPTGPTDFGTGCCYPFGGVTRSGFLALVGPSWGLGEVIDGDIALCHGNFGRGFEQIGHGMLMTSEGLAATVDTPVSLAADILTLPIAYARSKEWSWATWWGAKSVEDPAAAAPDPVGADEHAHDGHVATTDRRGSQ